MTAFNLRDKKASTNMPRTFVKVLCLADLREYADIKSIVIDKGVVLTLAQLGMDTSDQQIDNPCRRE